MARCECTIPDGGWCERHKVQKPAHWVRLCQTKDNYWIAWEENRGPGQKVSATIERQRAKSAAGGPGTELSKILGRFGIKERPGCKCKSHAARMDGWGAEGCLEHMDEIASWMAKEASKRKLYCPRWIAVRLVNLAIKRSSASHGLAPEQGE